MFISCPFFILEFIMNTTSLSSRPQSSKTTVGVDGPCCYIFFKAQFLKSSILSNEAEQLDGRHLNEIKLLKNNLF